MDFSVGIIIAMGLLVAGILGLISMDPGFLPKPAIVEEIDSVELVETGPQTHVVVAAEGSSLPGCEETNECYLPYSLTISAGDTVIWENPDSAAHTVTSTTDGVPDGVFESGLFLSNTAFEMDFPEQGTYDYFCIVHPWMVGSVIVE